MANNILNMHYDFKQKLNKVDSAKSANLKIPEIDWVLNEAQGLLIDMIAFPRMFAGLGFELNQRSIDDLAVLVKEDFEIVTNPLANGKYKAILPSDYRYHLSSYAHCKKGDCEANIRTTIVQHDDKSEESSFFNSSFEWREINVRFTSLGIILLTDNTFTVEKLVLNYLRTPAYIHAAHSFTGGTYFLPDGTALSGYQNCELSATLQREIVDLAVLITTGNLSSEYQIKQAKLQMKN